MIAAISSDVFNQLPNIFFASLSHTLMRGHVDARQSACRTTAKIGRYR